MIIFRKFKDEYLSKARKLNSPNAKNKQSRIIIPRKDSKIVELTLKLSAFPSSYSQGNEAWLLDICDASGCSMINWQDQEINHPLELRALGGNLALLFLDSTEINLKVPLDAQLKFFSHPWSGKIHIVQKQCLTDFNLYSPVGLNKLISVADIVASHDLKCGNITWREKDQLWLKEITDKSPDVISLVNPDWRGVLSATKNLVPDSLLLKDNLNELSAQRYAHLLLKTGCEKILIGGFPLSYELLIREIKRLKPGMQIFTFWLSSFLQSNEDYVWQSFQKINRLQKEGIIKKIGFAKKGMAESVASTGVKTAFVASFVQKLPENPSTPNLGGPHIGIWALAPIWRKAPYAMLAATAHIKNAIVFMVGQDQRALEFAEYLGINVSVQKKPLPQIEMHEALAQMHVNLYVTLSECSPMLPLESLSAGAPCLIGPTSHLFEDQPYLHSRLVVPYPDRAEIIAEYIERILVERDQIITEYKRYAFGYNEYAKKTLTKFLN